MTDILFPIGLIGAFLFVCVFAIWQVYIAGKKMDKLLYRQREEAVKLWDECMVAQQTGRWEEASRIVRHMDILHDRHMAEWDADIWRKM